MNDKTIAELREWKRNHYDSDRMECGSKAFDEILSHAVPVKEVEPLAVVSGKSGFSVRIGTNEKFVWFISLRKGHNTREQITAPTYAECEAKARAYLESLDDVKGGR